MERARLGSTNVEVTRLAFGAAPLGNLYTAVDDDDASSAVAAAIDVGVRFFDTAPLYGFGLSERRVGTALRAAAERGIDDVVVATKVGRLLEPGTGDAGIFVDVPDERARFDFSYDATMRSLEESLTRMGVDHVDVLHVHDPDHHIDDALAGAFPALREMRDQGVVGAIGAGMNQSAALARFVREADVDCVLLAGRYSLIDREGAAELLPLCESSGVSVIAAGIFNSGLLTDPKIGASFNYAPVPPGVLAVAQRAEAVCAEHGVALKAAALQFPLRHRSVACVLVGARSAVEVTENAALLDVSIPDELWTALEDVRLPSSAPQRQLGGGGRAWRATTGGVVVIGEQFLSSLGGFIVLVAFARWQELEEFGAFSLAMALYLVVGGFYTALVLEPASVLGAVEALAEPRRYRAAIASLHWRVTLAAAAVVAIPAVIASLAGVDGPLPGAFAAAGLGLPGSLGLWLARRLPYIEGRPAQALRISAANLVAMTIGAGLCRLTGFTTAPWALGMVAVASALPAVGILAAVRIRRGDLGHGREVRDTHWRYGRWPLAAAVVSAASGQAVTYIVAAQIGLAASGRLRAVMTLVLPITQVTTALGAFVLPRAAALGATGDIAGVRRRAFAVGAICTGVAAAAGAALVVLASTVDRLLYSGRYHDDLDLVPILVVFPLLTTLSMGPSIFLRAVRSERHYLVASVAQTPVTLAAALFLSAAFGLAGAAWAINVSFFAGLVVAWALYVRWYRRGGAEAAGEVATP